MKKYFIVSDIHGFFDQWMQAIKEKGFDINNPDHIIVVLGDLLDRGKQTINCLHFVNNLPDDRKILIRGNHEDLLVDVFNRGMFYSHDYSNGTANTCLDLSDLGALSPDYVIIDTAKENKEIWKYIDSTVDYAEVGDNIFVHGWIPCWYQEVGGDFYDLQYNPDWRNASRKDWKNARWVNGMKAWSKGVKEDGKTIWCGHYHSSWGHHNLHDEGIEFLDEIPENREMGIYENFEPFEDEGIKAIDACTAYTGKVNCVVLTIE